MFDFESISLFLTKYGVIIFAVFVILFALKLFSKKKSSKQGTTFYLLGECGSGKTSLLYLLSNETQVQTVSSLKENSTVIDFQINNKTVKIPFIDLPGHHHFREVFFQNISTCKGIIIMVDSTNDKVNANLAELLYNILTHKKYIEREMPILIVLNKQDLINARKQNIIEEELIKEIERIKISRKGVVDENEDYDDFLKSEENKFAFGEFDIKFCEASIKNENIAEITNFIGDIY